MAQVKLVDGAASLFNLVKHLQLRVKKGGCDFAGDVGRPDIYPSVLIDLPAQEFTTVSAFIADCLRALDEFRGVHAERTALAAGVVFGAVKAVRAQLTD